MKCEDLMILAPYKKECFSYFMLQRNPDDKLEIRVTFEVFSNKFENLQKSDFYHYCNYMINQPYKRLL